MVNLKKVFNKNSEEKVVLINFRVTESEKKIIEEYAAKFCNGNLTKYIKKALLEVMPEVVKEKGK